MQATYQKTAANAYLRGLRLQSAHGTDRHATATSTWRNSTPTAPPCCSARVPAGSRRLVPAFYAAGWDGAVGILRREPDLYPALGLHPVYVERHEDSHRRSWKPALPSGVRLPSAKSAWTFSSTVSTVRRQQYLFEAQLQHRARRGPARHPACAQGPRPDPVTLKRIRVHGGIMPCLQRQPAAGLQYFDLGFRLGFGGMLTFERSRSCARLARDAAARGPGAGDRCAGPDRGPAPRRAQQPRIPARRASPHWQRCAGKRNSMWRM